MKSKIPTIQAPTLWAAQRMVFTTAINTAGNPTPLKRKTNDVSVGSAGTRRHFMVTAAGASLAAFGVSEVRAVVAALIVPGIVAGLFGVWTTFRGEKLSILQNAQSLEMQERNARIAQEQLDLQKAAIDVNLVVALIQAGQKLNPAVVARWPVLQNTAFDLRGAQLTRGLTDDCDGKATSLFLQDGCVAVSRAGSGATLNPGETQGLAGAMSLSGEPTVPIPKGGFKPVGEFKTEYARDAIARSRGVRQDQISLVGVRQYTRARRPAPSSADMESFALIDRTKKGPGGAPLVEFEFFV